MEAETSRRSQAGLGRCWVLGMQRNDLISMHIGDAVLLNAAYEKQFALIFLVLGVYLRAIRCDAVYVGGPIVKGLVS